MLEHIFTDLITKYTDDRALSIALWNKIVGKYGQKNRFYHNLNHLEKTYHELLKIKDEVEEWDTLLFALFYHDYNYNVLKRNNEEKSAKRATKTLAKLAVDPEQIQQCKEMILATKGHQVTEEKDINYFTDADLAILGTSWKDYKTYIKQIRKEYKFYPDPIYKKGRVKVLKHLLEMPRIYKTDFFHDRFEVKAKKNIELEINLLLN